MVTYNFGFYYNEGRKVGYDISFPNEIGGKTLLSNVSYKDKDRIVKDLINMGYTEDDIEVQRVEN